MKKKMHGARFGEISGCGKTNLLWLKKLPYTQVRCMKMGGRYDEVCLNLDTVLAEVNKWQEIVEMRGSDIIVGI